LAQTAEGALGAMTENLQRIRELAVQSSNATNSDDDRVALQAEVKQLLAEVSRTASETNFNGRNLLDGSFEGTFQIGANAGQTVDVNIAELTAEKLGSSAQSGVSANGVNAALSNGDLSINGVAITASQATDDTASTADAANSSISKAAAINRVSDETGVTAFVNENTAVGTSQSAAAGTTTLTLNGVAIDLQTSTDAAGSRASVTESINAVADQTGVTAVDTGTDSAGVQLVAADGRNIEVVFSSGGGGTEFATDALAASATGLAAEDTYVGGYTLVSSDGPIEIDGGDGSGIGDINNTGLNAGTYERGIASATTDATQFSTTAGVFDGGTANFNGVFADATANANDQEYTYAVTVDGAETRGQLALATTEDDAVAALATAVNAVTGVTAWEETSGTLTNNAAVAGEAITIAGQAFTLASADAAGMDDLADQINSFDFQGAGVNVEITATSGASANSIELSIKNYEATGTTFAVLADNDFSFDPTGAVADTALLAAGSKVTGTVNYISDTADSVGVTLSRDVDGGDDTLLANGDLDQAGSNYAAPNGLGEGDLVINGVSIASAKESSDKASATVASDGTTIYSSSKTASAISVAEAINAVTDETGVTAEVQATKVVGSTASTPAAVTTGYEVGDQAGLYINGVSLGDVTLSDTSSGAIDTDKAKADAINLINQASGKTGVTAIDNGTSITLEAADGRNISVAIDDKSGNSSGTTGIGSLFGLNRSIDGIGESVFGTQATPTGVSAEGLTYETTVGKVELISAKEFEVNVGTNGKSELDALGFQAGSFGGGQDGQFLKDVDITTFEGAQAAITAIDNALQSVSSQRAELGALQNRFESTSSNLQITSENLSAANSRIRDADFAAETAELSRTQVLQQAGISILAQANQRPQQVLSLLG
jgi:flagellin